MSTKKGQFLGSKSPTWKGGRYKDSNGYVVIWIEYHPRMFKKHYVLEHRLIMEKSIGRYLLPNEHIHHKNGIKDDNRIENLEIIDPVNHQIHHIKTNGHPFKGKHHSEESKNKMSLARIGKKLNKKIRNKMSKSAFIGWEKRRKKCL